MPRIIAQAQAAIAASVGVNQPNVMPPMMIAGVSSAGNAATKRQRQHLPAESLVAAHVVPARAVGDIEHHEHASSRRPGMTPPRNSAPIETFAIMP